jgi:hypothetical protein
MSGFLGKDGFSWFFGVVEDRMDPLEIGRVKVRVFGYHDSDKNILPTTGLPWATVIQPPTSANFSGKGFSSVGLLEGTWVFGFFADPNSYQVPVVIGSISGLNAQTIKELNESYGTGFRDSRSPEQLKNYPTDDIEREYPQGAGRRGDAHGAQLTSFPQSNNYPTPLYKSGANKKATGTPDTNILALNDSTRINKTIIDLKTKSREDGGLREVNVPVADVFFPKFVTGVINATGVNFGTIKGLGTPPNFVTSSSISSMKVTSNQFKASPSNANAEKIHTGINPSDTLKSLRSGIPSYKNVLNVGNRAMSKISESVTNAANTPGNVAREAGGN